MGARMVPANGQITKTKKSFICRFGWKDMYVDLKLCSAGFGHHTSSVAAVIGGSSDQRLVGQSDQ